MLLSLIVTVAALAATLIAGASGAGTAAALAKMAASCGFLALAVTAGALHSNYGRVLLLGLVFSWWGDLFLIFSGPRLFLAGLIAFFLAHVAYSAAFLVHGVSVNATLLTLVALVVPVFVIYRWLNPHLDDLRG
ncbi:MAG: hypothetical protein HYZ00_07080, partial [Candidatus Hydrogenedentes bacterium]|nr:hypothetical protein [Candidatus Hydrogenedentota bacterium]